MWEHARGARGGGRAERCERLRVRIRQGATKKKPRITKPPPATYPELSEPGGASVRGRGALSCGSTRGARGAGAEPSGAKGCGFEPFVELPLRH